MEKMLPDNPPSQLFRLHAADAAPAAQLPLSAAGIDRFQVDRADPSNPSDVVFRATLGARSTVGGSHHFARYRLPPLAAPCPLAARVFVVRGPGGAAKPGCVVVVEMRASGKLTAALTGLVLDVEVPIAMGMPGRVRDWQLLLIVDLRKPMCNNTGDTAWRVVCVNEGDALHPQCPGTRGACSVPHRLPRSQGRHLCAAGQGGQGGGGIFGGLTGDAVWRGAHGRAGCLGNGAIVQRVSWAARPRATRGCSVICNAVMLCHHQPLFYTTKQCVGL